MAQRKRFMYCYDCRRYYPAAGLDGTNDCPRCGYDWTALLDIDLGSRNWYDGENDCTYNMPDVKAAFRMYGPEAECDTLDDWIDYLTCMGSNCWEVDMDAVRAADLQGGRP